MRIAGNDNPLYAYVLFVIFAILAGLMLIYQAIFLQKMKILPVYFIVLASICFCYENAIMAVGDNLEIDSPAVKIMYALQALEIPLLTVCLYETAYSLYQEKGANMAIVDVEEQLDINCTMACTGLWFTRLVAVCLLVLGLLVNYQLIPNQDYMNAGNGGYIYLAEHPHSLPVWLALIPPIVLSMIGLFTSGAVARYGSSYTIGLSYLFKWKILIFAVLAQAVGQIWDEDVYPVTSNAGELALLMGVTYFLHLAQDDLILTAHFADFLHQSNAAFQHARRKDSDAARDLKDYLKGSQDALTELNTQANVHISLPQRVEMTQLQQQQGATAV